MSVFFASMTVILCVFEGFYMTRKYRRNGFVCMFAFEAMYLVDYLIFPLFALTGLGRTDGSSQAIAVMKLSPSVIFINVILTYILLWLLRLGYHLAYKRKKRAYGNAFIGDGLLFPEYNDAIRKSADVSLLVGLLAILLLIIASGGLKAFISSGHTARGLSVAISDIIGSAMTPLVLLSQVSLLPPYIYFFLMKRNVKCLRWRFVVSCIVATIYLLFNQGKGPLLFALIPFILFMKKKKSVLALIALGVLAIVIAPFFDSLFRFFAYRHWEYTFDINSTLETFWGYYSLSFANFSYRHEILSSIGLRYGIDYINWIYYLIPNALLNLIGLTKVGGMSLVQYNTAALSAIAGYQSGGGLPMDMFLFNYIQFGIISTIAFELLFVRLLAEIDAGMRSSTGYDSLKILHYRMSIGVIMMINSFSIESIFRTRLDILLLIVLFLYITNKRKVGDRSRNVIREAV